MEFERRVMTTGNQCKVANCDNGPGDLDDGLCDLCGDWADTIEEFGGETLHMCDWCHLNASARCESCSQLHVHFHAWPDGSVFCEHCVEELVTSTDPCPCDKCEGGEDA